MTDFEDKSYLINSFAQINWPDPFPHEPNAFKSKAGQPTSAEDMVYDLKRFDDGKKVAYVVYIPRAEMMFKMMRACLDVTEVDQLWLYNDRDGKKVSEWI